MKYAVAVRLTIPLAKSWKCVPTVTASSQRSSVGLNVPAAPLAAMKTAQNSAPSTNPIVALRVRSDASIPTAISAAPMNQYPT